MIFAQIWFTILVIGGVVWTVVSLFGSLVILTDRTFRGDYPGFARIMAVILVVLLFNIFIIVPAIPVFMGYGFYQCYLWIKDRHEVRNRYRF